jgi:hypothetical protein
MTRHEQLADDKVLHSTVTGLYVYVPVGVLP